MTQPLPVLQWNHLTHEPIRVPVGAIANGSIVDMSAATVGLAFPVVGVDPVSYTSGTWDVNTNDPNEPIYKAQGVPSVSAVGDYDIWIEFTRGSDTVQRKVGVL